MFARGWACLHTARLLVPKIPAAKPCVSISSKLIENKRFQALYFGHLRKTGGRGSHRLVHTTDHLVRRSLHTPVRPSQKRTSPVPATSASLCVLSASALDSLFPRCSLSAVDCRLSASSSPLTSFFPLHPKLPLVSLLIPLLTQKQGEEVSLAKTLSCRLACFGCSLRNVGAPTFLIFPLIFAPAHITEERKRRASLKDQSYIEESGMGRRELA
jgi:hypothetical protein